MEQDYATQDSHILSSVILLCCLMPLPLARCSIPSSSQELLGMLHVFSPMIPVRIHHAHWDHGSIHQLPMDPPMHLMSSSP